MLTEERGCHVTQGQPKKEVFVREKSQKEQGRYKLGDPVIPSLSLPRFPQPRVGVLPLPLPQGDSVRLDRRKLFITEGVTNSGTGCLERRPMPRACGCLRGV